MSKIKLGSNNVTIINSGSLNFEAAGSSASIYINQSGQLQFKNHGTDVVDFNALVTGRQGPQGPAGARGPQGARGVQGIRGLDGAQGAPGVQGAVGIAGEKGDRGEKGDAGNKGDRGERGEKGDKGEGDKYATTSTSSLALELGQKNLTIDIGLSYTPNQNVIIDHTGDYSNYMNGHVVSYDKITGILIVEILSVNGSGTFSEWTVNLDGATGKEGPRGRSLTQGTGSPNEIISQTREIWSGIDPNNSGNGKYGISSDDAGLDWDEVSSAIIGDRYIDLSSGLTYEKIESDTWIVKNSKGIFQSISIESDDSGRISVKKGIGPSAAISSTTITKSHIGLSNVANESPTTIRNGISVDISTGKLLGIGTPDVVVNNEKVDATHIAYKVGVSSVDELKNSNVDGEHIRQKIGVNDLNDIKNVNVTKSFIGLGDVENQSPNTIRGGITIDSSTGKLVGIGTQDVVVSNEKVDATHIASKVGVTSVDELKNSNVDAAHIASKVGVASVDELKNSNVTKSSIGLSNVANESPSTIRNAITIDTGTGKLLGIGTSDVVVSNEKVDATHIASKVGVATVDELKNSNVDAAHIASKVGVTSVDELKNSNISITKNANTITLNNGVTTHDATIEKSDIGLDQVENKSSESIRSEITIGDDGVLSGIGTGAVVVSNEKVDATHIASKVGVDSVDQLKNSNISISKNSNTITLDNGVTTHAATIEKSDIGLDQVENKSSESIRSEITIGEDGILSGIGTGAVVVSNEKVDATHIASKVGVNSVDELKNSNVDAVHIATKVGVASVDELKNSNISISKNANTITLNNGITTHDATIEKSDIGLDQVENKSSESIRNEITISEDGILTGIGTGAVVVSNEKVDATHIASKVGVNSVDELKNSNISISKDSNTITLNNGVTTHTATIEKADVGLENVENKSSESIRSEITIGDDGILSGIGTGAVVVSNEKVDATHIASKVGVTSVDELKNSNVDAAHIASKVGVDSVDQLKNSNISISKDSNTITLDNGVTTHTATIEKIDIGLENVENKSSESIRNEITIGEDGTLSGIGTTGTVVSNSKINIDASGSIQGIGFGAGKIISNEQITITSSGTIQGIGSGAGKVISNEKITIDETTGQLLGVGTPNVVVSNSKISSANIASGAGVQSIDDLKNANVSYSIIKQKTLSDSGTTDKSSVNFNAFVVDYDDIGGYDYSFQIPMSKPLFTGTRSINGSTVSAKIVVSGSKNARLNASDHLYGLSAISVGTGSGNTYTDASIFIKQETATKPAILIESYTASTYNWSINYTTGADLGFNNNGTQRAYIRNDIAVDDLNFTGQHRVIPVNDTLLNEDHIGFIIVSEGTYNSTLNTDMVSDNISVNEALPVVSLSTLRKQKSVFGVISNIEDINDSREYGLGAFVSIQSKKSNADQRLIVNSLGEGGIWVSNINGNLENGDYITSCEIPGYGMKQDDDILHSYTVAKITCNCDFDLNSEIYRCEEFEWQGQTYRKAFVGCTYHCG